MAFYAKPFVEANSVEVRSWFDSDVFDRVDIRTFKPKNFVTSRWVLTVKAKKTSPSWKKVTMRKTVDVENNKVVQVKYTGSGVGQSSRGVGSASPAEILNFGRVTRLEIPAACASQGAIELLEAEQNPRQKEGSVVHSSTCRGGAGEER